MMIRRFHVLVFSALFIWCMCIPLSASAQDAGQETITLNGGPSGNITFPHHLHQSVVEDCMTCHKDFPQESGVLDELKKAGTLKKKQVMNATCLSCHRAMKKSGQKTGPVSCSQCHKK